jgi:hypothetical protein
MTERGKAIRVGQLMGSKRHYTAHFASEDEALEIAYSMTTPRLRNNALKLIADRMTLTGR